MLQRILTFPMLFQKEDAELSQRMMLPIPWRRIGKNLLMYLL